LDFFQLKGKNVILCSGGIIFVLWLRKKLGNFFRFLFKSKFIWHKLIKVTKQGTILSYLCKNNNQTFKMKTTTIILSVLILGLSFNSCNRKGCTDVLASNYNEKSKKDDGTCTYQPSTIKLKFSHNFNGNDITVTEFNGLNYVNANGETLSFTKLQYNISDIRFYLPNGDSIYVDGSYHLIDLEDANSLFYTLPNWAEFIEGKDFKSIFTGVGFNFGFDATDNVSGVYSDLNLLSWGWPDGIGGGYHQLKMEGRYINTVGDTISYQFHNGSATKNSAGTFESNYRFIKLTDSAFDLSAPTTIEIKMNMANWFQNPNLWNLNVDFETLMPNYNAQKRITQNAGDVFSVGKISQ